MAAKLVAGVRLAAVTLSPSLSQAVVRAAVLCLVLLKALEEGELQPPVDRRLSADRRLSWTRPLGRGAWLDPGGTGSGPRRVHCMAVQAARTRVRRQRRRRCVWLVHRTVVLIASEAGPLAEWAPV